MKPEDINVGETYNVRVRVAAVSALGNFLCVSVAPNGQELATCTFLPSEAVAFSPINPYPPLNLPTTTEIPEPAPKYDPCRKFRAGDIVEPCQVKGRWKSPDWARRSGIRCTVTSDEEEDGYMWVQAPGSRGMEIGEAIFFQLVTPVEELEMYYLDTITTDDNNTKPYFLIKTRKHEHIIRTFYSNDFETIEQTKAAAEAERDRLNEKW